MSFLSYLKLIWILAYRTFRESLKTRFFLLFAIFAFILMYISVLGSMLAISHEERVLTDISLLLMEILCIVYALFQVSSAFSTEIRNKTIYLVLSRPVPRAVCLAGKETGVMLSTAFIILVLSLMAVFVIKSRGLSVPDYFFAAAVGTFIKTAILTSFAFLLSLLSTSDITAFVMSGLFYVLGHVTSEIEPLVQKASGVKFFILKLCGILFPNLNLYSVRDTAAAGFPFTAGSLSAAFLWISAAYILSAWAFSRKEF